MLDEYDGYEESALEAMWDEYCREMFYENLIMDMLPIELPEEECPF